MHIVNTNTLGSRAVVRVGTANVLRVTCMDLGTWSAARLKVRGRVSPSAPFNDLSSTEITPSDVNTLLGPYIVTGLHEVAVEVTTVEGYSATPVNLAVELGLAA